MIRNYGVLDGSLGNFVAASGLQNKVLVQRTSGRNPDVDTVASEDVWNLGGSITFPTVAAQASIVSTSASDADGGAAVHAVYLTGLDENWDLLPTERVLLNGLTPVTSANSYIRIISIQSSVLNPANPVIVAAGNITASLGGNPQARIAVGQTVESQAITSIPRGYTGFIDVIFASGDAQQNFITFVSLRRSNEIFISGPPIEINAGDFALVQFDGLTTPIPEKSDIKIRAQSLGVNSAISASMTVIAVKNDYLNSLAESM